MEKSQATVRVRVLVAVDDKGRWATAGYYSYDEDACREIIFIDDLTEYVAYHWIEADVPIPTPQTIEGEVKDARS